MKDADGLSEWYSCMRASHCTLLLRACTITDVYVWAQTTAVFVRFLREASTFYALLTSKLQAAYGRLGFTLEFPGRLPCQSSRPIWTAGFPSTAA